jgi:hypothetical protein
MSDKKPMIETTTLLNGSSFSDSTSGESNTTRIITNSSSKKSPPVKQQDEEEELLVFDKQQKIAKYEDDHDSLSSDGVRRSFDSMTLKKTENKNPQQNQHMKMSAKKGIGGDNNLTDDENYNDFRDADEVMKRSLKTCSLASAIRSSSFKIEDNSTRAAKRLIRLWYASKNQQQDTEAVGLWNHLKKCNGKNCQRRHCASSRVVLKHYSRCQKKTCDICSPLKRIVRIAREQERKGELGKSQLL